MEILEAYKSMEYLIALNALQDLGQAIRAAFVSCLISLTLVFTFINLIEKFSDFSAAIESVLVLSGYSLLFPMYLHMIFNRTRFTVFLDELNGIVNERIGAKQSDRFYAATERKITYFTKMALNAMILMSFVYLYPLIRVSYHWCVGIYTLDSWTFIYKMWFPLKMNSTFNNFLFSCTEWASALPGILVMGTAVSLFFGVIMYTKAILNDITSLFHRIDAKSVSKESTAEKYCIEAINLHTRLFGCIDRLADIMNAIIFIVIVPGILCSGASLYMIQKNTDSASLSDYQLPIAGIFLSTEVLGIFFYCGHVLFELLIDLSDKVYESEWYRHPHSFQMSALLMIQRAQRPFFISAFGLMKCNLESYIGILRAIFSAVMIMRRINQ